MVQQEVAERRQTLPLQIDQTPYALSSDLIFDHSTNKIIETYPWLGQVSSGMRQEIILASIKSILAKTVEQEEQN